MAKIKKSSNSKCWQGCWETGPLTRWWWEGHMEQTFWKAVCHFLNNYTFSWVWPEIALLGICVREMKTGSHNNLDMNIYSSMICNNQPVVLQWARGWCVHTVSITPAAVNTNESELCEHNLDGAPELHWVKNADSKRPCAIWLRFYNILEMTRL